jgi:hypothetical protein
MAQRSTELQVQLLGALQFVTFLPDNKSVRFSCRTVMLVSPQLCNTDDEQWFSSSHSRKTIEELQN